MANGNGEMSRMQGVIITLLFVAGVAGLGGMVIKQWADISDLRERITRNEAKNEEVVRRLDKIEALTEEILRRLLVIAKER